MVERGRRRATVTAALIAALLLAGGCGGGDGGGDDDGAATAADETTTSMTALPDDGGDGDDSSTTLPPGATPGLDDYSGDGELDPTCGTQDFGEGLVLRKPCEVATPNEPPEGVTLVPGSLFGYNGSTDIPLDGISGSLLLARDEAGVETVIVTFNSDNLFEINSSEVRSPDTMDNTIKLINQRWPNSTLQVRGHTDGTGGANANQRLSLARAESTKNYMVEHGLKAKSIATVGLGATQPFAREDNDEARKFNRRVEIVIRVA